MARKVIDADFEYVCGPMRVGDEHPSQRGWYYTGRWNRRGLVLWYQPPGRFKRWVRRFALTIWVALVALGMFAGLIVERPVKPPIQCFDKVAPPACAALVHR